VSYNVCPTDPVRSCTMIITEPNDFVREVHDRMPVLLEPDQFTAWLDGSAGKEVLKPARDGLLQRRPVSKRVNSSRTPADDPTLIEPIAGSFRNRAAVQPGDRVLLSGIFYSARRNAGSGPACNRC
jgi:putative SOS response-associated peptidase YedK